MSAHRSTIHKATRKLERWHGSVKAERVRPGGLETLAESKAKVAVYVEHYNHSRLAMRPAMNVWPSRQIRNFGKLNAIESMYEHHRRTNRITFPARPHHRVGEFHYTPKHGSWLNIAENELSSMTRQCVTGRRFGDIQSLRDETSA